MRQLFLFFEIRRIPSFFHKFVILRDDLFRMQTFFKCLAVIMCLENKNVSLSFCITQPFHQKLEPLRLNYYYSCTASYE